MPQLKILTFFIFLTSCASIYGPTISTVQQSTTEAELDSCETAILTTVYTFRSIHSTYPQHVSQLDTTVVFPNLDTVQLTPEQRQEVETEMAGVRSFMNNWKECKSTFDSISVQQSKSDSIDILWLRKNTSTDGHRKQVSEHWRIKALPEETLNAELIKLDLAIDSLTSDGTYKTYSSSLN